MDQQLLKTANRKQQNTDNVLLLVENSDIKLEILNKSTHLNLSQTQITAMSDLFFCEGFSLVHVIITTMISRFHMESPFQLLYDITGFRGNLVPEPSVLSLGKPTVMPVFLKVTI